MFYQHTHTRHKTGWGGPDKMIEPRYGGVFATLQQTTSVGVSITQFCLPRAPDDDDDDDDENRIK